MKQKIANFFSKILFVLTSPYWFLKNLMKGKVGVGENKIKLYQDTKNSNHYGKAMNNLKHDREKNRSTVDKGQLSN